jgi:hypothetical protein
MMKAGDSMIRRGKPILTTLAWLGALAAWAVLAPAPAPALEAASAVAPALEAVSAVAQPGLPAGAGIVGDYMEARTADVYTGPCFANSEVNLAGKQAVLAWRVTRGAWQGVPLDGLAVAAAVRAAATLGDPYGGPLDPRSVIVVDQRATPAQRDALVAFAHSVAGNLLSSVVAVASAPIDMGVGSRDAADPADPADPAGTAGGAAASPAEHHHPGIGAAAGSISGEAHLRAGDWIDLSTRALNPKDHLCGNEEIYYPPLTADSSRVTAVPAVTVVYDFTGPDLGMVWSSPDKRSAFVGHFAY